jgi:thiol-disulfide isomerase/thioredoxin
MKINVKRIFISTMLGLAALKAATMLYAVIDNPIIDIKTSQELDQFLKANPLAVVEFHDLNCPVCQAFQRKGIFKQTASALPHIKFAKVSVQDGLGLHKEYKIYNYPTFIFFRKEKQVTFTRDNKKVDRFLGYVDNPNFTQKVSGVFAEAELADK